MSSEPYKPGPHPGVSGFEGSATGGTITFAAETTVRMPKRIDWLPCEDITAYELAIAVPCLFTLAVRSWGYPEDDIAALPENVRRHFKIHD